MSKTKSTKDGYRRRSCTSKTDRVILLLVMPWAAKANSEIKLSYW